jgi:hypothetical protein
MAAKTATVAATPKARTAKTTAKKAKTAKAKPMTAKQYAQYLKYVNQHYPSKTTAKPKAWSPDDMLPVCSARAVAESLRLALGVRLADGDVLSLHRAAGGDQDAGTTILDTLSAAGECQVFPLAPRWRADHHGPAEGFSRTDLLEPPFVPAPGDLSVILGLDLPYGEPHAVTAGPDGTWWSWGEPHDPEDFPGAVIDEAWAVTWT